MILVDESVAYAYETPLDLDRHGVMEYGAAPLFSEPELVRGCESQSVPSGHVKIAIEHDHRNSGFSNEKWSFSIAV